MPSSDVPSGNPPAAEPVNSASWIDTRAANADEHIDVPTDTQQWIGKTIAGRYTITSLLGKGGMGIVYEARHETLQHRLALKVLARSGNSDQAIARFLREAQAASRINHENVVQPIDFGTLDSGAAYYVMEFVDGANLKDLLLQQDRPFSIETTIDIITQVCRALRAAHDQGVVHRDLKPDNIAVVTRADGTHLVKVLDFGLARWMTDAPTITQQGQVFGTPHYMSPEQCLGQTVDEGADIYAAGVILYEMLSGAPPFAGDSSVAILSQHIHATPPPLPAHCPSAIAKIVRRCLKKKRGQRFANMSELEQALSRALDASRKRPPFLSGGKLAVIALASAGVALVVWTAQNVSSPKIQKSAPVTPVALSESKTEEIKGYIELRTLPTNARVVRNGKRIGRTPMRLTTPREQQSYTIEIRKTGFRVENITIQAGGRQEIEVVLVKVSDDDRSHIKTQKGRGQLLEPW